MKRRRFSMNLQLFAEPGGAEPGAGGTQQQTTQVQTPEIDYEKLSQAIAGKQSETEDKILRGYFKQQGLSQEDAEKAMATFKAERAKNQPDIGALQTQLTQAQSAAQKAQVDMAATMAAVSMGIDAKTIPYVLKMADMSQVVGQYGKINEETLKKALNKVLEDIPALKPQAAGSTGFVQIGATGGTQAQSSTDEELDRIFGVKKK